MGSRGSLTLSLSAIRRFVRVLGGKIEPVDPCEWLLGYKPWRPGAFAVVLKLVSGYTDQDRWYFSDVADLSRCVMECAIASAQSDLHLERLVEHFTQALPHEQAAITEFVKWTTDHTGRFPLSHPWEPRFTQLEPCRSEISLAAGWCSRWLRGEIATHRRFPDSWLTLFSQRIAQRQAAQLDKVMGATPISPARNRL